MNDERIITAVEVTDGASSDERMLIDLIDKASENEVNLDEIIDEIAYVDKV